MIYTDINNNKIVYGPLKHKQLKRILHILDDAIDNNSIDEIRDFLRPVFMEVCSDVTNPFDEEQLIKLIVLSSFDNCCEFNRSCKCGNAISGVNFIKSKVNKTSSGFNFIKSPIGDSLENFIEIKSVDNMNFIDYYEIKNEFNKTINNIKECITIEQSANYIKCRICDDLVFVGIKLNTYVDIINMILSQYSVKYIYELEMYLKRNNFFNLLEINEMYVFELNVYKMLMEKEYERRNKKNRK
jgi:hypothetical protein